MTDEPARHQYPQELTSTWDFLIAAGYRFSLDFDDEVMVEYPEELDRAAIEQVLQKALYGIQCRLRVSRRRLQQVFVGGPLAGQPHRDGTRSDGRMFVKIGPKRWACYARQMKKVAGGYLESDDPRLYFLGIATSERNARESRYVESAT